MGCDYIEYLCRRLKVEDFVFIFSYSCIKVACGWCVYICETKGTAKYFKLNENNCPNFQMFLQPICGFKLTCI